MKLEKTTKILIVDDHPVVRKGLAQIISDEDDLRVIAEVGLAKDAFKILDNKSIDFIILDLKLPDENGLEVLTKLNNFYSEIPVLILSAYPEEQYGIRSLKNGASGYMHKETAAEELINAIREIINGGKYISKNLSEILANNITVNKTKKPHEILSLREFEVLMMIGLGKTVKQIAEKLSLSTQTISTYRTRILNKMKLNNNAELIRYCFRENLID